MGARAAAERRRWHNAQVVREADTRKAWRTWSVFLAVLAAGAPLVGYLLVDMSWVQVHYRIESLREERSRIQEEEQLLRTDRARMESLPVVERRATRELRLRRLPAERCVVVHRSGPAKGGLMARAPDPGKTAP